ncbi:MAG: hypothetical protein KJZ74_10755 [Gemmatimonadales bacterium]|nr:hypothetical protein [Gemmatimonadota bacterium]MCL4214386.1 hypothetical protein [Gemmatimonadales bacterium]
MHAALLHSHNLLRWVVLVLGALALVRAYQGVSGDRPYAAARRVGVFFVASLHLQLLLGLALFLVSPMIKLAMTDMRATMSDAATRFFVAEHPTLMVAAVVLMTIGGIVAKNAANDAAKHRKALVFIAITMLMLLFGIPWQRALLPGMG